MIYIRRSRLPLLGALALAGSLNTSVAWADFRLCNSTSERASVAIAYTDGKHWISEGWYNLKGGGCQVLLKGPLAAEFYYIYGVNEDGGEWKGDAFMCTQDHKFRIVGRTNCLVRGYDRTGFIEIDTGASARSWTVQLTSPVPPKKR